MRPLTHALLIEFKPSDRPAERLRTLGQLETTRQSTQPFTVPGHNRQYSWPFLRRPSGLRWYTRANPKKLIFT